MTNPPSKRVSSAQLPSATELIEILAKESQREAVKFDFLLKNPALFNDHRKLASLTGADEDWIDNFERLSLPELMEKIDVNHAALTQYIKSHQSQNELYEKLYNSLIPQVKNGETEAIFVFGAATNARIERAVELYEEGIAPKIIISGNKPHYKDNKQSEAQRMADFAVSSGVPREAIVTEEASITLPDNVKCTIDLLEEMNWKPRSLTIIATDFVLTRAMMEWYKFCPWDIEITPIAAHPQLQRFTADGWVKDDTTIALVLNEYVKLVVESKIDYMRRDSEIVL